MFEQLAAEQAAWSHKTFGSVPPTGPLRHLMKEAQEALDAWEAGDPAHAWEEVADCLILVLDISRRMNMTPELLLATAEKKLAVLKTRTYPTPVPGQPTEHVR